jgi:anti-sigma regulatory factor (Ser/Thr protein kinase)
MEITITSEQKLVRVLRGAVRQRARESGFDEEDSERLASVIDEAACSVIRDAYQNRPGFKLSLQILSYPDRLEFILEDFGPKVPGRAVRPGAPYETRPAGPSTIIRMSTDAVSYDENPGERNRLKLVKFLPGKEPKK